MMFLELTEHDDTAVIVAVDQIAAIRDVDDHSCRIHLSAKLVVTVKHSANEVLAAVLNHSTGAVSTHLPPRRRVTTDQLQTSTDDWPRVVPGAVQQ